MADILETVLKAENFNTLVKAIDAVQLREILKSPDPVTIFAPTDEAFAKLPEGTLDSLLQDIPKLKKIVTYHIAFGDVRSDDLAEINEVETVEGSVLAIESANGTIEVNNTPILKTDIVTDNGTIHTIDTVLMPAIVAGN